MKVHDRCIIVHTNGDSSTRINRAIIFSLTEQNKACWASKQLVYASQGRIQWIKRTGIVHLFKCTITKLLMRTLQEAEDQRVIIATIIFVQIIESSHTCYFYDKDSWESHTNIPEFDQYRKNYLSENNQYYFTKTHA